MEEYVLVYAREKDHIRCYIFDEETARKVYIDAKKQGINILGVYKKLDAIDEYMFSLDHKEENKKE